MGSLRRDSSWEWKKSEKKKRKEGKSAMALHVFGQDRPHEEVVFFLPTILPPNGKALPSSQMHPACLSNTQKNQILSAFGSQVSL